MLVERSAWISINACVLFFGVSMQILMPNRFSSDGVSKWRLRVEGDSAVLDAPGPWAVISDAVISIAKRCSLCEPAVQPILDGLCSRFACGTQSSDAQCEPSKCFMQVA